MADSDQVAGSDGFDSTAMDEDSPKDPVAPRAPAINMNPETTEPDTATFPDQLQEKTTFAQRDTTYELTEEPAANESAEDGPGLRVTSQESESATTHDVTTRSSVDDVLRQTSTASPSHSRHSDDEKPKKSPVISPSHSFHSDDEKPKKSPVISPSHSLHSDDEKPKKSPVVSPSHSLHSDDEKPKKSPVISPSHSFHSDDEKPKKSPVISPSHSLHSDDEKPKTSPIISPSHSLHSDDEKPKISPVISPSHSLHSDDEKPKTSPVISPSHSFHSDDEKPKKSPVISPSHSLHSDDEKPKTSPVISPSHSLHSDDEKPKTSPVIYPSHSLHSDDEKPKKSPVISPSHSLHSDDEKPKTSPLISPSHSLHSDDEKGKQSPVISPSRSLPSDDEKPKTSPVISPSHSIHSDDEKPKKSPVISPSHSLHSDDEKRKQSPVTSPSRSLPSDEEKPKTSPLISPSHSFHSGGDKPKESPVISPSHSLHSDDEKPKTTPVISPSHSLHSGDEKPKESPVRTSPSRSLHSDDEKPPRSPVISPSHSLHTDDEKPKESPIRTSPSRSLHSDDETPQKSAEVTPLQAGDVQYFDDASDVKSRGSPSRQTETDSVPQQQQVTSHLPSGDLQLMSPGLLPSREIDDDYGPRVSSASPSPPLSSQSPRSPPPSLSSTPRHGEDEDDVIQTLPPRAPHVTSLTTQLVDDVIKSTLTQSVDRLWSETGGPDAWAEAETEVEAGGVKVVVQGVGQERQVGDLADPQTGTQWADTMADTSAAEPADVQKTADSPEAAPVEKEGPKPVEYATFKYRWGKVVETSAARIVFFNSLHPKDPVFLHWSPQLQAYFSDEVRAQCGDFTGHVIVEGKTYPVEVFNIRSYTFEVDLFLKDDVIEDEVGATNTLTQELRFQQQQQKGQVDTYRDISTFTLTNNTRMEDPSGEADESGMRHSSKYEDLLRHQLHHKDSLDGSLENETALSHKSDHSAHSGTASSKRLTPVGDVDKAPLHDGFDPPPSTTGLEHNLSGRSSGRHTPQQLYSGSSSDLRRDFDRQSGDLNPASGDEMGSTKSLSRPGSQCSRSGGPYDSGGDGVGSRPGSGLRTLLDARINDVLGATGSRSSSARQTPTQEPIGDVLGGTVLATSPARSHTSSASGHSIDREVRSQGSVHSASRGATPQQEPISPALRSSQERLYSAPDMIPGAGEQRLSRPSSQQSSRSGSRQGQAQGSQPASRAQSMSSLSSELELSQFLDIGNRAASEVSSLRTPPVSFDTHPDESTMLPPIMRDRPASLPHPSTQPALTLDRRSYTPDHHALATVPAGFTEFLGRPRPGISSRNSSRTVTPVPTGAEREDGGKVHDLEDTVATLRKLLSNREQEVHDLTTQLRDMKDINHSLKKDLEHARARRTPTPGSEDLERRSEQLLKEKEILAVEVVKLQDKLNSTRMTSGDRGISDSAMQRRVEELEAHVRDLRHSNDAGSQKVHRLDMRIKELMEENDRLRSKALHTQNGHDDKGGRFSDRHMQTELQQLKEDVRTLRERNFALQEENLRLKDTREPRSLDLRSRELLRELPARTPVSSTLRADDGYLQRSDLSVPDKALHHTEQLTSPRYSGTRRPGDRSGGSDGLASREKDPLQRSLDRSFGSDHGTRIMREAGLYTRSTTERTADLRRTDPGRYDLLRSRPDGEVSEKLHASSVDGSKYATLSADKLRSLEAERSRGDRKLTMSAERLRILEEAERNRERRAQSTASDDGRRASSGDSVGRGDGRQQRVDANHSDDSDSTAVLMSYDAKADTYCSQRQRDQAYSQPSRQSGYMDRGYFKDANTGKEPHRDYREMRVAHRENPGDDSDTATDILLNTEAGRTGGGRYMTHRSGRRSSLGDDSSLSSPSDQEEHDTHRRSKSMDTRGKKGSTRRSQNGSLFRPASSTDVLAGGKTMTLSSGFRSVTPQPLATQHNKAALQQHHASLSSSLTQGLRPFAPRSPADVRPDDLVKFSRQGGKLSQGTVKFVGHLPGRSDVYLGVELYKEEGKHDGTFEDIRYFKCKPNKGVFVAFNKVVMAWAPN